MISYYKYTEGEAFTINGSDYVGFFNVIDGKAYTGKAKTTTSEQLIAKETFISEIYLKKLEFDSNYEQNFDLLPTFSEKFDIFTKSRLENIIERLNLNNLNIYKSLVLQDSNFLGLPKKISHYYGLSSTYSDMRNNDDVYGKSVYTQIDPFESSGIWGFLDEIKTGTIIVTDSGDFTYFCADDINVYTITGSITDPTKKLVLTEAQQSFDNRIQSIVIDDIDSNIIVVRTNSMTFYEYETFLKCGKLLKKDWIDFQKDLLFVRIGNSIRLEIKEDTLYIKNKYSNDTFYEKNINFYNLGTILSCEVRIVDDLIAIISKKEEKIYITYIDPEFPDKILNQFEMLYFQDSNFNFKFSDIDSNLITVSFNDYAQTRFISNPKYPASTTTKNVYSKFNFKYLKDYVWDGSHKLMYNSSNAIKWNSNSLKSNSYNNILVDIKNIGDSNYIMIHNIGRIYTAKKKILEDFKIFKIPINLPKAFNKIECSNSSFGLYLNNNLKNIVTDIVNIYTNAECKSNISPDGSEIYVSELENIKISIENMFFNGNEQLNVATLNRIFETIVELQRKLIN